jgi:hypothetical protein
MAVATLLVYVLVCSLNGNCGTAASFSPLLLPILSVALAVLLTSLSVVYVRIPIRAGRLQDSRKLSLYFGVSGLVIGFLGLTAFYAGSVFIIASILYIVLWRKIPVGYRPRPATAAPSQPSLGSAEYLRGFNDGMGYVEVPCRVCGKPIRIDTRSGRANEIIQVSFHRFEHRECAMPRPK